MHLLLGRPDFERRSPDGTGEAREWTYYTMVPRGNDSPVSVSHGEIKILFVALNGRSRYQIVGDFGPPGMFPRYVRDLLEFAKLAAVNPSFGRPFVR